jgi:hypothetical protein
MPCCIFSLISTVKKIDLHFLYLILNFREQPIPLIPIDIHSFYGELEEHWRVSVKFLGTAKPFKQVMIFGEPYHLIQVDAQFEPDAAQWKDFEGIYKDPSNHDFGAVLEVTVRQDTLVITDSDSETICRPFNDSFFLSDYGTVSFRKTKEGYPVLIWGEAAPYFPINVSEWKKSKIINYLFTPYSDI